MDYKEKVIALLNDSSLSLEQKKKIEEIFPELKKSEDERVRKMIINIFKDAQSGGISETIMPKQFERIFAWLEKQGEQISVLKDQIESLKAALVAKEEAWKIRMNQGKQKPEIKYVYPKFRVGDVIEPKEPNGYFVPVRVKYIGEGCYRCESDDRNSFTSFPICKEDEYKLVEQKPTDKIESHFHVEKGKWYICISQFCNCIEGMVYKASADSRIIDDYGTEYDMHSDAYKYFRLWTIQDAKDGDVLVTRSNIVFLFQKIMEGGTISFYAALSTSNFSSKTKIHIPNDNEQLGDQDVFPANKEQRDQLEKAMTDAGYKWDADKKELKKVEQKPDDEITIALNPDAYRIGFADGEARAKKELKPAEWCEEDEKRLKKVMHILSLDGRISNEELKSIFDWLKSLRPQKQCGYNPYKAVVESIAEMCDKYTFTGEIAGDFLNNVKAKCKDAKQYDKMYPQKHWKPTEEQMKALDWVVKYDTLIYPERREIIKELLEQLKKL